MKKYIGLGITLIPAWALGVSNISNYYKVAAALPPLLYCFHAKWYKGDRAKDRGLESATFSIALANMSNCAHVFKLHDAPWQMKALCSGAFVICHAMMMHRFLNSVAKDDESFIYF